HLVRLAFDALRPVTHVAPPLSRICRRASAESNAQVRSAKTKTAHESRRCLLLQVGELGSNACRDRHLRCPSLKSVPASSDPATQWRPPPDPGKGFCQSVAGRARNRRKEVADEGPFVPARSLLLALKLSFEHL